MSILLHDLTRKEFESTFCWCKNENVLFALENKYFCTGCLDCWVKNRSGCIINDEFGKISCLLSENNQLNIVCKCLYGGYSRPVKSVIEKAISYSYPHFSVEFENTHHVMKFQKPLILNVIFYGKYYTEEEKNSAINIVKNNCYSMNPNDINIYKVRFVNDITDIKEEYLQDITEKRLK